MKKTLLSFTMMLAFCSIFAQTAAKKSYPEIDIPFKKFKLDNGLTLIVHEDHKAPVAAFNIWYHVGSKNEKPGKTGFAHLFEHLMFNGSEHYNDDYFQLMESIGGTDVNGTTNHDRTNYFETFPVNALDKVLWVESDRMGFLLKAVDSGKLAEQRGVVQNEKRYYDNQPYSISEELTVKSTYPAGHPYSWSVIGSMEDLDAASLKDVQEWFKTYYGPNNAVIVIAGDVNPEDVFQRVKKYFGDIPASPPIAKHTEWIAPMKGKHYQVAQDRAPQARLQKTWNVPSWGSKQLSELRLLGSVLASGKTSRLYKRLVYDEQLASNISMDIYERELSSQFYIYANAKPGVSLGKIDTVINEELKKILATGPTVEELERAKSLYFSRIVKGLERIGGNGKSDLLAEAETFGGDAAHYKKVNQYIREANPADIQKAGQQWLSDGEYVLHIVPYGKFNTTSSTLDRNEVPALGPSVVTKFPEVKQFSLRNGLKVALVERRSVPKVDMSLRIDAGYAADMGNSGLSTLTCKMLTEGTKTRTSLQISDQMADLGATILYRADVDYTDLMMSTLSNNFDASMALFADVLLNPAFPQKEFERKKKEQLLSIKQEQSQPSSLGLRVLPKIIYGAEHSYSTPFTGSGSEASLERMKREDLVRFHDAWFAPNNAMLTVVGDITEAELRSKLEKHLATWKSRTVPKKNVSDVPLADKPTVYIIDRPDAPQSDIFAATVGPKGNDPDFESIDMANRILGGDFTSRINMNLREDKHWSYGTMSINRDAKGPGMFYVRSPVQTDKTKESMQEMLKELTQYVGDKPATEKEFQKFKNTAVLELPGVWQTNNAVLRTLENNLHYGRSLDYLKNYPNMLQNMKLEDVQKSAKKLVHPNSVTWLIIGDRKKIEAGIRELNFGEIKFIDPEGNPVK